VKLAQRVGKIACNVRNPVAGIGGDFAHAVTPYGSAAWATAKVPLPTLPLRQFHRSAL